VKVSVRKADKAAIESGRTTRSTRVAALRLRAHLIENGVEPRDRFGWREYKHWAETFLAYYDQARSVGDGLGLTPTQVAKVVRYNGPGNRKGRREQHVLAVMGLHTIREERGIK
jgi:hypothetical protein